MPVLICLRKKLWTRTYSTRDQVPTCPVFTRAKIKSRFGILKNLPSQYIYIYIYVYAYIYIYIYMISYLWSGTHTHVMSRLCLCVSVALHIKGRQTTFIFDSFKNKSFLLYLFLQHLLFETFQLRIDNLKKHLFHIVFQYLLLNIFFVKHCS